MEYNRTITVAMASSVYGPWRNEETNLLALYTKLGTPAVGADSYVEYMRKPKRERDRLKDVGAFVGGALVDDVRKTGHVQGRDLLTLDIDNLTPDSLQDLIDRLNELGKGYCMYSTRKHDPNAPRIRLLLPLKETMTEEEYEPCARYVARTLDPTMKIFDPTTFQSQRAMYLPSICKGAPYLYKAADRPLWDGYSYLAFEDWGDVFAWPRCPAEDRSKIRAAAKQQNPLEKSGPVGRFCKVYDIPSVIDTYLSDVYTPCDTADDRYTYTLGSSYGGAVMYENGLFLYSNHATDPACGQLCNAFDLVRIHKYGELDNNAAAGTPVAKLPSWKAMLQLVDEDKLCQEQAHRERVESLTLDFEQCEPVEGDILPKEDPFDPWQDAPEAPTSGGELAVTEGPENPGCGLQALIPANRDVEQIKERLVALEEQSDAKLTSDMVECALNIQGAYIGYNVISKRLETYGLPKKYECYTDPVDACATCASDFLRRNSINASVDACASYIKGLAERNSFNPVVQWLRSEPWDGKDRWPWVYGILGVTEDRYKTYIRKWFLQSVALAHNDDAHPIPGDGALVLQGAQGAGKTLFFRKFAYDTKWFKEGAYIDITNKDTLIKATGGWICELGELDSTIKKEQASLKAFLTASEDEIRVPFGRSAIRTARRTSFCATVNPADFLRDETGSRRFWVVPVTDIDRDTLLTVDKNEIRQVWLQTYDEWFWNPEGYHLTAEESRIMQDENTREFSKKARYEEELMDFFDYDLPEDKWSLCTAATVARVLFAGRVDAQAIGNALGSVHKKDPKIESVRVGRACARMWKLPIKECYRLEETS